MTSQDPSKMQAPKKKVRFYRKSPAPVKSPSVSRDAQHQIRDVHSHQHHGHVKTSLDEDVLLAKLSALNEKEAAMQQEKRNLELSLKMQKMMPCKNSTSEGGHGPCHGAGAGGHGAGTGGHGVGGAYDDTKNINYHATYIQVNQHQQNIVCNNVFGDSNIVEGFGDNIGGEPRKKKRSKKRMGSPPPFQEGVQKSGSCSSDEQPGYNNALANRIHRHSQLENQGGNRGARMSGKLGLPGARIVPQLPLPLVGGVIHHPVADEECPVQELPIDDGECAFFDISDTPRTRMMRESEDPIGNWFDRMESPPSDKKPTLKSPKIVNYLNMYPPPQRHPSQPHMSQSQVPARYPLVSTYPASNACSSNAYLEDKWRRAENIVNSSPACPSDDFLGTPPLNIAKASLGSRIIHGTPPPLRNSMIEKSADSDSSSQCTEVSMHVLEAAELSDNELGDEPGCRSGRTSSAASSVSLGSLYACDTPKSMGSLYGGSEGEEENDESVEEGVQKTKGGASPPENVAVLNMCNLAAHNAGLNAVQADHMKGRTFLPKSVLQLQQKLNSTSNVISNANVEASTSNVDPDISNVISSIQTNPALKSALKKSSTADLGPLPPPEVVAQDIVATSSSSTTVADDTGSSADDCGIPFNHASPDQPTASHYYANKTPDSLREVSVQEGAVLSPPDNDVLYVIKQT